MARDLQRQTAVLLDQENRHTPLCFSWAMILKISLTTIVSGPETAHPSKYPAPPPPARHR